MTIISKKALFQELLPTLQAVFDMNEATKLASITDAIVSKKQTAKTILSLLERIEELSKARDDFISIMTNEDYDDQVRLMSRITIYIEVGSSKKGARISKEHAKQLADMWLKTHDFDIQNTLEKVENLAKELISTSEE